MPTTTVDVEFRAKLADLKREIESVPGITRKETRAMVAEFQKAWKKTEDTGKTALGAVASEASKLQRIGGLVGGPFGAALQVIADGSESAEEGLSGASKAALAFGAVIAVVTAVGAAIMGVVANLEDYRETLDDLERRQIVTHEQVAMLEQASAAFDTVKRYAEAFVVQLAVYAAPAIRNFMIGSVGAFAFLKTFVAGVFEDVGNLVSGFARVLSSGFSADAITGLKDAASDAIDITGEWRDAEEAAVEAVRGFAVDVVETQRQASTERRRQVQSTARAIVAANREEEASTEDLAAAAIAAEERRAAAAAAAAEIVQGVRLAMATDEERIIAARDQKIADYLDHAREAAYTEEQIAADRAEIITSYDQQIADRRAALAEEEAKRQQDQRDEEMAQRQASIQTILGWTESFVGAVGDLTDAMFERQTQGMDKHAAEYRKAMRKKFAAEKALALVQIALRTAAGIMQAIAMYGPPPSPMGIAGIAVAAALGVAEAAVVAAQKPALHTGGTVAPDEVDRRLQVGEGVLSRRGMAALGGADALDAVNRGAMPAGGAPQLTLVSIDGGVLDRIVDGRGASGRAGLMARIRARTRGVSGRSDRW